MGLDDRCASTAELLAWYRQMLLVRRFDDLLLALRSERRFVGAVHPYAGHEAIAVGMCAALSGADVVVSYYRGVGHAITAGADLDQLLAERLGHDDGYCRGRAGEFVVCRPARLMFTAAIVGSGTPIAAGAALAEQVAGTGGVAVVFFGDGALGAGVVHETMNLAAIWRLPLIFVCEHNGYQDHTRTEDVFPDSDLVRLAEGHRIPAVTVDGNDVEAVHAAGSAVMARARAGGGPSFIEAKTYLSRFHLQFDEPPASYRPPEEEAAWLRRDPLRRTRAALAERGVVPEDLDAVECEVAAVVDDLAVRVGRRPAPPRRTDPAAYLWVTV